jgi:hypothetical protein
VLENVPGHLVPRSAPCWHPQQEIERLSRSPRIVQLEAPNYKKFTQAFIA